MIKPGDLIDDTYHVLRILGEGGMGVVVEARDMKLDALVAIKFMKPEVLAEREVVERFLQEARALARLKSQHAVKVYSLGTYQGAPFIVMEHLEGAPLNRYLDRRGHLPPEEAASYLLQACEAIGEAHSLGIFHRDIKPANMFLAKGASGKTILKVLDFGIAKMVRQTDETLRKGGGLTGTYTIMGTPMYMSPEQMRSTRDIDGRSDIWSLGVVLYELVTGEWPFEGESIYELQKAIIELPPIRRQLPPAVEAIIHQCLQKERTSRFQTVEEFAAALRSIAVEPGVAPAGPSVPSSSAPVASGGTVVMNGPGTVTVPQPAPNQQANQAPNQAPTTISDDLTRRVDQTPKSASASARRRNAMIALAGIIAFALLLGSAIFGMQAALSEPTMPIASASAAPPAPSAQVKNDAVPEHSTTSPPIVPIKEEIPAPRQTTTLRDAPTPTTQPKTSKTATSPAPSPTPAKTVNKRHE